jgi:hypothetical protein
MDMENLDLNKQNYADMTLQILSAYISGDEAINFDLASSLMDSLYNDPDINGPGFLPGVFFASIIHMSLMLQILATTFEISKQDALSKYALSYENVRELIARMPQVHPSIVNEIVQYFEED